MFDPDNPPPAPELVRKLPTDALHRMALTTAELTALHSPTTAAVLRELVARCSLLLELHGVGLEGDRPFVMPAPDEPHP
jgi:hypothetical protein